MGTALIESLELPYFDNQTPPPYRGSTREAFTLALNQGGIFAFPGEGLEDVEPGSFATLYEYRRHNPGRISRHRIFVPKHKTPEDEAKGGAVVVLCWLTGDELESFRGRLESLGWASRQEGGQVRPMYWKNSLEKKEICLH